MYFYRLGYYSYEDSSDTTLCHENLYSEEEFNDIIATAFAEISVKEAASAFKALPDYVKDAKSGHYIPHETYSDCSGQIVKRLVEKHGFYEPSYTCEHFVDGWKSLLNVKEDSESKLSKNELGLHKKLKEKWLDKFKWLPKNGK